MLFHAFLDSGLRRNDVRSAFCKGLKDPKLIKEIIGYAMVIYKEAVIY